MAVGSGRGTDPGCEKAAPMKREGGEQVGGGGRTAHCSQSVTCKVYYIFSYPCLIYVTCIVAVFHQGCLSVLLFSTWVYGHILDWLLFLVGLF